MKLLNLLSLFFIIISPGHISNATPQIKVSVSSTRSCSSPVNEVSIIPPISEAISTYLERLDATCSCRDDPTWTRVGHLDMTNSSQFCPSAWAITTSNGIRGCGRPSIFGGFGTSSCNSVSYFTHGARYSQVCGRIIAYQYGEPEGFDTSSTSIDSYYIDGVSLTHGLSGSRTHVWSFVNAQHETANTQYTCPCMLSNSSAWPHSIPSFVGDNYFCATATQNSPSSVLYTDNPLFDGVGCTGDNTCCRFNQPPWFCRTLPTPTTDDLEVRICADGSVSSENTFISNLDLYIK